MGAWEIVGCIDGTLLGTFVGAVEMVGEPDGCEVGRADTVGLELIEGTADGEEDGADDTVGFELIEGLPVGDLCYLECRMRKKEKTWEKV